MWCGVEIHRIRSCSRCLIMSGEINFPSNDPACMHSHHNFHSNTTTLPRTPGCLPRNRVIAIRSTGLPCIQERKREREREWERELRVRVCTCVCVCTFARVHVCMCVCVSKGIWCWEALCLYFEVRCIFRSSNYSLIWCSQITTLPRIVNPYKHGPTRMMSCTWL